MDRRIPEGIVAVTQELASDLAAWCGEGRGGTLAGHEAAVLERVRGLLGKLLGAVLAETTPGLDRRVRWGKAACPGCARATAPWCWRERTVETRCGTVTLPVQRHHCARCRRGWSSVETVLEVGRHARMSAGLEAWIARAGGLVAFREAAALLAEYTGLVVGAETVRRHTERAGAALADAEDAAAREVERTREAAEAVDPAPGHLVAELDGVMAPYRAGWHEVKVGAIGGIVDGAAAALSYVAAREGPQQFGARLLAEAARRGALEIVGWTGPLGGRGLARLRPVVVLGDGARWIWALAAEHLGDRVEIVDYYHATQHLWAAAHAAFGRDAPEAATWARAQVRALYDHGAPPVRAALAALRAPSPEAATALRRERGYFRTNAARMAYPDFRARGFPIGSGAVESAARHVIQLRMKRPGMRWSDDGGRAIAALRARLRPDRPLVACPTPLRKWGTPRVGFQQALVAGILEERDSLRLDAVVDGDPGAVEPSGERIEPESVQPPAEGVRVDVRRRA